MTTNIKSYQLKNKHGLTITIANIGAAIQSVVLPDGTNIVLGLKNLADYKKQNSAYLGVVVGRLANRVANAQFAINGTNYPLEINEHQKNCLHSGGAGLHQVIWDTMEATEKLVKLHYFSPDGEGGFPGNVDIFVTYQLNDDNELKIDYYATTDQTTPLDLTNHTYWNLAGAGQTILEQTAKFYASHYLETDAEQIPTGKILAADFHEWQKISRAYDDYFITDRHSGLRAGIQENIKKSWIPAFAGMTVHEPPLTLAAEFRDPQTQHTMHVFTDQPGFQFYTGNHLKDFPKYGGFCVETHNYPTAVNNAAFPSCLITPDKPYRQTTIYKL